MPQIKLPPLRIPPTRRSESLSALRPDDMLSLRFSWVGLERKGDRLVRTLNPRSAVLVVHFEPQHLVEQCYWELEEDGVAPPKPVGPPDGPLSNVPDPDNPANPPTLERPALGDRAGARLSGSSRLAFVVPSSVKELDCTLEALLRACTEFEPSVVAGALPPAPVPRVQLAGPQTPPPKPPPKRAPAKPKAHHTAIEAPWRLVLSPSRRGAWLHAREPVRHGADGPGGERVELWHTRLAARAKAGPVGAGGFIDDGRYRWGRAADGSLGVRSVSAAPKDFQRSVRAIWSPDYVEAPPDKTPPTPPPTIDMPFRTTLDGHDRHELVALTTDYLRLGPVATQRRAIRADALVLSALGASLDLDYRAPLPPGEGLAVEAWRHRGTWGRDHYVRVIYGGYVMPTGHPAVVVKVSERKFSRRDGAATDDALLRQRMYIVVRRPEMRYPAAGHQGRQMPLRSARLMTLVTPNLDPPETDPLIGATPPDEVEAPDVFWPSLGNTPFMWPVVAEDWEGRRIEFSTPLVFVTVRDDIAYSHEKLFAAGSFAEKYHADVNEGRRTCQLRGQRVAYAETDTPGSTALETVTIELGVVLVQKTVKKLAADGAAAFSPVLLGAEVLLPGAKQLASAQPLDIKIDGDYVANGWTKANSGAGRPEVFARVNGPSVAVSFSGDRAGGVALPNMQVTRLSRVYGPVAGPDSSLTVDGGGVARFNAADYFGTLDAKLLGGVLLSAIFNENIPADANAPRLTSREILADGPGSVPTQIETRLHWATEELQDVQPFATNGKTSLTLDAFVLTDLTDAGSSTTTISGSLTDFRMDLFGFIDVPFDSMTFDILPGAKPDFTVAMGTSTFGGALDWVNELSSYLGQGGGPPLEVTAEAVELGFSLDIPTLAVGVLTIQNISFHGGLMLPFDGNPARLRIGFCTREQPFVLTVLGLGGGGFFMLGIGLDGVEQVEMAIEFGASIAIYLGVASGEVHLLAGIYFQWLEGDPNGEVRLEGYLRMGGELEVLGIISMSLEFDMKLGYQSGDNGGIVWGEATLTVEVEIAMFSKSVEVHARREFSDPPRLYFHEQTPVEDFSAYLAAFDPAGA